MKNIFKLFVFTSLVCVSLTSCGDEEIGELANAPRVNINSNAGTANPYAVSPQAVNVAPQMQQIQTIPAQVSVAGMGGQTQMATVQYPQIPQQMPQQPILQGQPMVQGTMQAGGQQAPTQMSERGQAVIAQMGLPPMTGAQPPADAASFMPPVSYGPAAMQSGMGQPMAGQPVAGQANLPSGIPAGAILPPDMMNENGAPTMPGGMQASPLMEINGGMLPEKTIDLMPEPKLEDAPTADEEGANMQAPQNQNPNFAPTQMAAPVNAMPIINAPIIAPSIPVAASNVPVTVNNMDRIANEIQIVDPNTQVSSNTSAPIIGEDDKRRAEQVANNAVDATYNTAQNLSNSIPTSLPKSMTAGTSSLYNYGFPR